MHRLIRFAHYLWQAKDEHGVHSPFVFELYAHYLRPARAYYVFEQIEARRRALRRDKRQILMTDFGAGSWWASQQARKVSAIARHSLSRPKTCELSFKLVEYFRPQYLLELGTSLGIHAAYMAAPFGGQVFKSLEGCPHVAAVAREQFAALGMGPEIVIGNIDQTLPEVLGSLPQVDMVFLDANHRYEPTLRYFEWCVTKAHEDTVLVFDDIHWSAEMTKAWQDICRDPRVRLSVDLYQTGIVFFRKGVSKEHFVLRY